MARITKPNVLIGAKGRLGNLVIYELNGVQVVRSLPGKKKKNSATELQKLNNTRFQKMHLLAKSVQHEIIKRIWNHFPATGGLNGYNMFIKANRMAFGNLTTIAFPELLVVSKGELYPVSNFKVEKEGSELRFSWINNYTGKHAAQTDKLNLLILSERTILKVVAINAFRKDEVGLLTIPEGEAVTEGYAFWSSADDKYFSASVYWQV